jgi:DNA-binding protein H-NS
MKTPTRTAENSELKRQAEAAAARRANGGKPVAMYRNTGGSTWTGRGLKPRWLVEAIEAGRSQDEFLIGS